MRPHRRDAFARGALRIEALTFGPERLVGEVITATELQLLACFGVEPVLLDPTDPWCYNDAAYTVDVDGYSGSFAVAPAYRDVRIIVIRGDRRIFEFNSMGVRDVRVIDEPRVDAVEVLLPHRPPQQVNLSVFGLPKNPNMPKKATIPSCLEILAINAGCWPNAKSQFNGKTWP